MATIDSLVWVRRDEIKASAWPIIEKELLIVPKPRATCAFEYVDGVKKKVWREEETGGPINTLVERDGLYGIPINYAIHTLGLDPEDGTSLGQKATVARLPDPHHPSAPPNQAKFFRDVLEGVMDYDVILACAPTGSGKTVTVLNAAGTLQRTTLIVVPNTLLANQWVKEIKLHLGLNPRHIGYIGGGREQWEGRRYVVAIIHNLFQREFPAEFYRYFGFVAWDEGHTLGAPEFSKTMTMFPARYKISVSATPGRKDGLDTLLWNYFGHPRAVATAPALATTCWRVPFPIIGVPKWIEMCRNDVKPMKWLSQLKVRNDLLVRTLIFLYKRGYSVIAMSKFIDHVEVIQKMLIAAGVPADHIGQMTRTQGKNSVKVGQAYLDSMVERPILLGTYSMLKVGFDDPKRDAGVELLPVGDNIQGIGRVRRPCAGKKKPLWFTIEDLNIPLFERYSKSRLRGFAGANVELKILKEGSI